jgi:hypothetical protein
MAKTGLFQTEKMLNLPFFNEKLQSYHVFCGGQI